MKLFRVRVIDSAGKIRTEEVMAPDSKVLREELSSASLSLLDIESEQQNSNSAYSLADRLSFFEALSALLTAHILLPDAVDFLSREFDGRLRTLCLHLGNDLRNGKRFSHALEELMPTISIVEIGLLRIGESVGSLAKLLPRLVRELKRQKAFREKVVSALSYPLFVFLVLILGVSAFIFLFLPAMQVNLGIADSQASAKIQRTVSIFAVFLGFLFSSLVASVALSLAYRRSKQGDCVFARKFESYLRIVPVVGRLLTDTLLVQVNQTLSLLVDHGVPLEESLRICAGTVDHAGYAAGLRTASEELHGGQNISAALEISAAFPRRMIEWIRIVERTGEAGKSFSYLAEYYEERYDRYMARSLALVEPVLIVLVGIVVLFVVLGTLVPFLEALGSV